MSASERDSEGLGPEDENVSAVTSRGASCLTGNLDRDVTADAFSQRSGKAMAETPSTQPEVFDFRKSRSGSDDPVYDLATPVFFVGFMGAGKTSVARKLARMAGVAALDMDTYIERHCDMKVKEIFAESGEAGFRSVETEILRELAVDDPRLISCGGGVVLAEENRRILREHGFVIYLQVTAAEAASRISDVSTRPLFGDLEQAERVIHGRLPLYEEVADLVIDTAGRGSGSIAREAFGLLKKEGVLTKAM